MQMMLEVAEIGRFKSVKFSFIHIIISYTLFHIVLNQYNTILKKKYYNYIYHSFFTIIILEHFLHLEAVKNCFVIDYKFKSKSINMTINLFFILFFFFKILYTFVQNIKFFLNIFNSYKSELLTVTENLLRKPKFYYKFLFIDNFYLIFIQII